VISVSNSTCFYDDGKSDYSYTIQSFSKFSGALQNIKQILDFSDTNKKEEGTQATTENLQFKNDSLLPFLLSSLRKNPFVIK
jgi:hypothetical protein